MTRRLATAFAVSLALLAPVPVASAAEPSAAEWEAMGSTHAPAYVLPPGCHWYSYSYTISPPEPEWSLEVIISDAGGTSHASSILLSGADPTSGTQRFQLCASNTDTGVFTIRGRLSYKHYASSLFDETRTYSGWIRTSYFTVTKPHHRHRSARCVKARKKAKRLGTAKARRAAHRACRRH